jgi:hypothetical protein
LDSFNYAAAEILALSDYYGTSGVQVSVVWIVASLSREQFDISSSKIRQGLAVIFALKGSQYRKISETPAAYTVSLKGGWRISFGAEESASDATLMQHLSNITAPWLGNGWGTPWQIYLAAQPWRVSETGEIALAALPEYPQDQNPHSQNPRIPLNATLPRTFIRATRPKEIRRLLKFGRDSDWPLSLTIASTLDCTNSIEITYRCSWEDCDASEQFFFNQFITQASADALGPWKSARMITRFEKFYMRDFPITPMQQLQKTIGFPASCCMDRERRLRCDAKTCRPCGSL